MFKEPKEPKEPLKSDESTRWHGYSVHKKVHHAAGNAQTLFCVLEADKKYPFYVNDTNMQRINATMDAYIISLQPINPHTEVKVHFSPYWKP
jgi:hypothetical protein